jgi:TonB family protein
MALVNRVQYDQFSPGKMVIRQTPVSDNAMKIKSMKIVRLILLLCLFQSVSLFAQVEDELGTILVVEQMPTFKGGSYGFLIWVYQNLKYPQTAINDSISGRVIAKFRIDSLGVVDKVEIVRGIRWDLDQEVIRVLDMSPKWNPGLQNHKGVSVWYTVPVDFSIKDPDFTKYLKKYSKKYLRASKKGHNS